MRRSGVGGRLAQCLVGVTPTITEGQDAACRVQPWDLATLLLLASCKAFWDKRSMAGEEGLEMVAGQGQRRMGVQSTGRGARSPFAASAVCWQSVALLDFNAPSSACLSLCVCASSPFLVWRPGSLDEGTLVMLQQDLIFTIYICNDPLSNSGHVLRSWGLRLECIWGEGGKSAHDPWYCI